MTELDRAYQALNCPMPECGEQLYVRFDHTVPIMLGHLDDRDPISPEDGDVGDWKVECIAGHVVLVPGRPGCTVDHGDQDCDCDVDHGEEARTFRASDSDRLRAILQLLAGRDLACWCPLNQPCHADVLLDLANRPVGNCIGCQHDLKTGPCGGCGAVADLRSTVTGSYLTGGDA